MWSHQHRVGLTWILSECVEQSAVDAPVVYKEQIKCSATLLWFCDIMFIWSFSVVYNEQS